MSGTRSAWRDAHQLRCWCARLSCHWRHRCAEAAPRTPDDSAVVVHPPLQDAAVYQGRLSWCWDGAPRFGVAVRAAAPGAWIVLTGCHQDAPLTQTTGNGASRMPPQSVVVLHWGDGVVAPLPWQAVGGDWDHWELQGRQRGAVWLGELLLTCFLGESVDLLPAAWELVWRLRVWGWCDRLTCEPVSRQRGVWWPQALVAP